MALCPVCSLSLSSLCVLFFLYPLIVHQGCFPFQGENSQSGSHQRRPPGPPSRASRPRTSAPRRRRPGLSCSPASWRAESRLPGRVPAAPTVALSAACGSSAASSTHRGATPGHLRARSFQSPRPCGRSWVRNQLESLSIVSSIRHTSSEVTEQGK